MQIKKVFNNNVVLTENRHGKEMVVMGKELAFQRKAGEAVDQEQVEKTFVLENENVSEQLAELLADVPETYLAIAEQIISLAKEELGVKLDDYLYVALTDHLSFAIRRYEQGMSLQNTLAWEIKKYYRKEFAVALKALNIIEAETGHRLDEHEAASITLHLVNSQMSGEGLEEVVETVGIVNDMLNIVKYHFQMELDEDTLNYERFLTHLRFFAWRLVRKERLQYDADDDFLYQQVKKQYKEAFLCSEKIKKYVENKYEWNVSNDELIYLTVHIHRVASRHQLNKNHSE